MNVYWSLARMEQTVQIWKAILSVNVQVALQDLSVKQILTSVSRISPVRIMAPALTELVHSRVHVHPVSLE